jgi:type III secretory pathway component EscV
MVNANNIIQAVTVGVVMVRELQPLLIAVSPIVILVRFQEESRSESKSQEIAEPEDVFTMRAFIMSGFATIPGEILLLPILVHLLLKYI